MLIWFLKHIAGKSAAEFVIINLLKFSIHHIKCGEKSMQNLSNLFTSKTKRRVDVRHVWEKQE